MSLVSEYLSIAVDGLIDVVVVDIFDKVERSFSDSCVLLLRFVGLEEFFRDNEFDGNGLLTASHKPSFGSVAESCRDRRVTPELVPTPKSEISFPKLVLRAENENDLVIMSRAAETPDTGDASESDAHAQLADVRCPS